jgi:hypothetical protein
MRTLSQIESMQIAMSASPLPSNDRIYYAKSVKCAPDSLSLKLFSFTDGRFSLPSEAISWHISVESK